MPPPSKRLTARIRRDFPAPGSADEVIRWLSGLPVQAFGRQDPERVQTALVLAAAGRWNGFSSGIELLGKDWRDVLIAGGLADEDWPERLADELSAPEGGN